MPKRWKIASGGSWTWQYIDTDQNPPRGLAQSMETWERKREVRAEIEEMKNNNDIEEDEGDD
jgi:hypothetical protein